MHAAGAAPAAGGRRVRRRDCCRLNVDLPTTPPSVPAARTVVAGALDAWGLTGDHALRETALLVLSELTTNAVRHAAALSPRMHVSVALADGALTVAVHDRHPLRPATPPEPHPDGTGGWGLRMVEALVAEAGGSKSVPADPDGAGKTVVVRLPLP
ncbi:ATP-binding protein [Streptomyces capparidis]